MQSLKLDSNHFFGFSIFLSYLVMVTEDNINNVLYGLYLVPTLGVLIAFVKCIPGFVVWLQNITHEFGLVSSYWFYLGRF